MADIVVSGNSSGSVTLRAPDVSGTTILTLPTTTGTLVVTGGAQTIEFADGTVSAPSITNSGDTNTGIFFPAADTIAFTEGGVESMRIDSSGNLLINNGNLTLATNGNSLFTNYIANNSGSFLYYSSSANHVFNTAGTERMRIDSSGNILIGATSNIFAPKLGVTSSSSFPIGAITSQIAGSIFSKSTDGAGNQILFLSNNNFNYGIVGVNNANGTSAGDQFQLGYVASAGAPATGVLLWGRAATCVGLNTAPATSGTGITFPATQNASSDANTLDDYEEGTWTPGISGRTFSTVFGMYRKIGSCVYVYGDCNSINSSISDPAITGLPFAATNSSSAQYGGYFSIPEPAGWTLSSGYTYLYYRVDKNSTSGLFLQGDGRNHTSGTSIGTGGNFRFSGFYFTD